MLKLFFCCCSGFKICIKKYRKWDKTFFAFFYFFWGFFFFLYFWNQSSPCSPCQVIRVENWDLLFLSVFLLSTCHVFSMHFKLYQVFFKMGFPGILMLVYFFHSKLLFLTVVAVIWILDNKPLLRIMGFGYFLNTYTFII